MASKKTIVAAAAGVMALGAGLGVAGLASADPTTSPSATPTSSTTPSSQADPRGGGWGRGDHGARGDHGDRGGAIAVELATKLGIDQAKVSTALQTAREATRPTTAPTPGEDRPDPAVRDAALAKALADELKIDEARIKTALDEIRATHATERAAALKTRLDAAVQAGTLTQAEADAVTKAVKQGVINAGGPR